MEWISVKDRLPEKENLPKGTLRAYLVKSEVIYGVRDFKWVPGDILEGIGGFDGLNMTTKIIMFTDKQERNCMVDLDLNGLSDQGWIKVTHWKPFKADKELSGK